MQSDPVTEPRLMVPRLLSDRDFGAVQELSKRFEAAGRVETADAFASAVLERESLCSTVLESGVAIPHARGGAVRMLSLAAGVSPVGIRWGVTRPQIVRVVFLCAVPLSAVDRYLNLIAALSRFVHADDSLERLTRCRQPEEMARLLEPVLRGMGAQD